MVYCRDCCMFGHCYAARYFFSTLLSLATCGVLFCMHFASKNNGLGTTMLGISAVELLMIAVIAIVLIPSKDIPKVLKFLIKGYRQLQGLYTKLLRELNLLNLD